MYQKYDITLKALFKDVPKVFLKLITGYETGKFIDVQFPDIQLREADVVLEVADGKLIHIEIQSTNVKDMLERMLMYIGLILKQYKRLPTQIVLYVGNEPMNMKNHMEGEGVKYSYKLIDIREIDCRQLLESDIPEDMVLAILCKTEDVDVTIRKILDKLTVLPLKEREGYIRKLLYLSDLRKLYPKVKMEVNKMPITIDVKNSDIYQEGKEEGLLEGERRGLLEGERKGLFEGRREGLLEGIEGMLELKYASAGLELMNMVRAIPTVDKLEEFKNLIKKAGSVDELRGFLTRSL
ncbi:hypothetical protein [Candidatus Magnetominusculus xianensis]|uniref:Transposase (Putative), YhgA-like protein n=1 Tax=Candidatus Magnetominusculus xianensis TaxID=1748249 RepID=A0ABR5SAU0_9BACT|nr:hypothetical protein [Candidatus Magnetominusculus xianensis]KWT74995.1 hypothetical protein ASN18_3280 [Candidatus Magnetominusculus xianensis]MBF0404926.1 Rpn family recombination-promoting nuclease/putative transposase [Nitrospirota bacterium]